MLARQCGCSLTLANVACCHEALVKIYCISYYNSILCNGNIVILPALHNQFGYLIAKFEKVKRQVAKLLLTICLFFVCVNQKEFVENEKAELLVPLYEDARTRRFVSNRLPFIIYGVDDIIGTGRLSACYVLMHALQRKELSIFDLNSKIATFLCYMILLASLYLFPT